jgi:hypothetical protein
MYQIKSDIRLFAVTINQLNNQYKLIGDRLAHTITCPNCNHEFMTDNTLSKEESENQLKEIADNVAATDLRIKEYEIEYNTLQLSITEIQKDQELDLKAIDELTKKSTEVNKFFVNKKEKIKEIEVEIAQYKKDIEKVSQFDKINAKTLDNLNNDVVYLQHQINKYLELRKEKHLDLLNKKILNDEKLEHSILTKKKTENDINARNEVKVTFVQFKSYLVSHYLKSLNRLVNDYLHSISDDFTLIISDVVSNKKGELQDKISIRILKDGKEFNYPKLSSGEKIRIDLSLLLAFRQLYMNQSKSGGLNFMSLDEVTAYLDATGTDKVIDVMNKLFIPGFVVTQLEPSSFNNQVLTVKKINGISHIN